MFGFGWWGGYSRGWLVETGSEERDEFASICHLSQEDVEARLGAAGLSGLAPIVVERAAQLREQAEAMRAGNVRLLLNELAVYKGQYASLQCYRQPSSQPPELSPRGRLRGMTRRWYRIFPTGLSTAFTCAAYPRSRTSARPDRLRCISPARYAIQIEPVYENTLTPLDWLMFEWIERRWAPKHHHNREGTVVVDENAKGRFF